MPELPEWLANSLVAGPPVKWDVLTGRLTLAIACGCGVAAVYRWTHRGDTPPAPGFIPTLVLLAVLIAVVAQVISGNIALAFSLVGVLSIVRFRTVVEDTRDTAFVIFAVVVGMAIGAGHPEVGLAGLVAGSITAFAVRPSPRADPRPIADWSLTVRVGIGGGATDLLEGLLHKHFKPVELLALATARQGAAIDYTYRVRPPAGSSPMIVVAELNRLDGVQSVELRRL